MACIASVATLATDAPRLNALPLTVRNERLLNGLKGGYAIEKERALAMKSRISTTEISHVQRLICWLETVLIQVLLSLTLWPLKLIYSRPIEAWWVWDTNRKLCNLDQRFC